MSLIFTTGDDVVMSFSLFQQSSVDGELIPISISAAATVKAVLASPKGFTAYSEEVDVFDTHEQSDWSTGQIVTLFERDVSALVTDFGDASVQIMVDDGGRKTYGFDGVEVVRGQISVT